MSMPWFLKPDWLLHAELLDQQEELSHRGDLQSQSAHQEIADLRKQVRDLERQLLALETVLAAKGIIEQHPDDGEQSPAADCPPAEFPTRTRDTVQCPRCGKAQQGNRDRCYSCLLPFRYGDE